jgi:single-strand DNA-binding protein
MSNVMTFTGNLARDAEVKFSQSGMAILSFSVANTLGYGDKKQTLWFRVTVFGKRAEGQLKDYLKKGTTVLVSGEFSINEYKANDGTTKTSLEIIANLVDLVGKRPERDDSPVPYSDDFGDKELGF